MSDLALDFYKAFKARCYCLHCLTTENLEFHHVTPAHKLDTVWRVANQRGLKETIKELNKCVVLCQAFHKAVHAGHHPGWLNGLTDKGKPSGDHLARVYMPIIDYIDANPRQGLRLVA